MKILDALGLTSKLLSLLSALEVVIIFQISALIDLTTSLIIDIVINGTAILIIQVSEFCPGLSLLRDVQYVSCVSVCVCMQFESWGRRAVCTSNHWRMLLH